MRKPKIVLIVPTIREECIRLFLYAWREEFFKNNIFLIVVEDHLTNEIKINEDFRKFQINWYTWKDIDAELGKKGWIIPRRNAAIRNFGLLKALEYKPDMVVSLDDDCYPDQENFFVRHWQFLNTPATLDWVTSCDEPTRGFPYKIRNKSEVVLNHGLWSGVPDYDGITFKKSGYSPYKTIINETKVIPRYNYFPFCSMNFSYKPFITTLMYLPLMGQSSDGKKWQYDRFDDIWGGIILKKVCDHLGLAIRSGSPSVEHRKASDIDKIVEQEKAGMLANEYFWKRVDKIKINSRTIYGTYIKIASKIETWKESYFQNLGKAMKIWADLVRNAS